MDYRHKNVFRARSLVSSVLSAYKRVVERLPEDDPSLEGDDTKITQILHSLVNNAVQHAPQGVIIVSLECKEKHDRQCELILTVQDTGPGMSQEVQRHVTERITDAAESHAERGLALCKQYLNQMHGSITFISALGLGTKFTVSIECQNSAESQTVHGDTVLDGQSNADRVMKIFRSSGANGALMAAMDWSKTPLGPIHSWPQSLITTASVCLTSRFPMLIWWGPQLTMLYNDSYALILQTKHPRAMGQPGLEVWKEIAPIVGPMLHSVMQGGPATWSEDQMLVLERNGFAEECFFTFSYSAIHDETNRIAGIFTAVFETTKSIIAKRRLSLLKEIGRATSTTSTSDAFQLIGEAIATSLADVPFGLLYGLENQRLMLKASFGLPDGHAANVTELTEQCLWPYMDAIDDGESYVVHDLEARFGQITCQPWPQPVSKAVIIPIRSVQTASLFGILIVGTSPALIFDENYRTFVELIADRITNIFGAIQDYEAQRHRADELAKLDKAKTQFFTNISHEFRTPLALMLGPLADSLGDETNPLNKAQRDRQEMIQNNALRLLKLVNNILDFSRIEAGRTQLNFRAVDLRTMTQQLCSTFQSVLEQAGIQFNLNLSEVTQSVYVDVDMWEKIVLNLLSNAFKFTFQGSITVTLEEETNQVLLKVTDTGVGIADDEQPRIFERFYRAEHSKGRSFEGSGIGLALIQELVKLHGGTISFTSRMGQGTQFTVAIPLGNDHLPSDRIKGSDSPVVVMQNRQAVIKEAEKWIPEPSSQAIMVQAITSPDARPHVLLVDDNVDMRTYIHKILSPMYDVTLAKDGQEALDKVRENAPDLILSDVMMPRLDGFGLIRQLHANHATKGIPVILLSARAGDEAKIEGLGQGADDYLVKTSFSEKELLARVKTHFELGRLRRHLQHEVDKKTEELRRLNTALYEFIDMICHEIRNPLHGLIGNWELLFERLALLEKNCNNDESNELDFTEVHEFMDNMKECTAHQARLMDEVVMLTKLYSNKFELSRCECEPSNLLQEVLRQLQDMMDQQFITVSDDTHLKRKLEFDRRGYMRILNALLTFSVNNTQPGSVIHVTQSISAIDDTSIYKLRTKLTCTTLSIDRNIFAGLSSLHQHSFSHRSVGGRYSNTGFSLAISNLLVKIMGGEPTEILDGDEKGFSFTILCYPVEKAIALDDGRTLPKLRVPKKRVLVAEDNYINQVLCRSLLKKKRFDCVIANDGKEAMEKFQLDYFDFVLMDIAMPYFNGIEVTRKIRQMEEEQQEQHPVLIIGLSAYAQSDKVKEALAAGMDDFISKPATFDKISSIIDRWR